MKVKVPGWAAVQPPDGGVISNDIVDINDDDDETVAYFQRLVDDGTVELVESAATGRTVQPGTAVAPPKAGPRSGRAAWAAYAEAQGVGIDSDMSRDDIIAAIELAQEESG